MCLQWHSTEYGIRILEIDMQNEIVKRWAKELALKLGRDEAEIVSKGLSAYDFSSSKSVEIYYSLGSIIKFNLAFMVMSLEKRCAAVFTEHYGYHEFSLYGAVAKEITIEYYVDKDYEGEGT